MPQRTSRRPVRRLAAVFVVLVPFFLPAMHERYFYLADVLSVIVAFHLPRRLWPVPVLVQFASAFSYVPFLSQRGPGSDDTTAVPFWILALAMLAALGLLLWELIVRRDSGTDEPVDGQVPARPPGHQEYCAITE